MLKSCYMGRAVDPNRDGRSPNSTALPDGRWSAWPDGLSGLWWRDRGGTQTETAMDESMTDTMTGETLTIR
jgi:hypothetical protein